MSIIELLSPFRAHIASRSWDQLEHEATAGCIASDSSSICRRISEVDTDEYEGALLDAYVVALDAAVDSGARWIALNYLVDRDWRSVFTIGDELPPAAGLESDSGDVGQIVAPRLAAFAELRREAAGLDDASRREAGRLLAARTVALFGRIMDAAPSEGFAIVVAENGEEPVLVMQEGGDEEETGRAPKLVTVSSYSRPFEAQFAHARLEAHGINAYIHDAHTVGMNWLYSNAIGGVKLKVADRDLDAARAILSEEVTEELEALVEADASFRCPKCGSLRTRHVPIRAPWYRYLWGGVILLLGLPAPLSSDDMTCDDCGNEWKREEN